MPNLETAGPLVEMAAKCLAMADSGAPDFKEPLAGRAGVGHGLKRGEGLGGDEEERFVGVEVETSFGEMSVPSTLETKRKVRSRWV